MMGQQINQDGIDEIRRMMSRLKREEMTAYKLAKVMYPKATGTTEYRRILRRCHDLVKDGKMKVVRNIREGGGRKSKYYKVI